MISTSTLFIGEHEVSMDVKNRLIIPADWKELIGEKIVVCVNPDGYLEIRKKVDFEKMCEFLLNKSSFNRDARVVKRWFMGTAREILLDKWRRFVIPHQLMQNRNFEGNLILVGNGDLIEIWGKKNYEEWKTKGENGYLESANRLSQI